MDTLLIFLAGFFFAIASLGQVADTGHPWFAAIIPAILSLSFSGYIRS